MMHRTAFVFAATCLLAALPAMADDPSTAADLKATIALHGMKCDQVTESKRSGDSDYLVTCGDGNHYHVYVDAQGRVVVEKR